ncbi:unnamed protein product [Cochlearia groenlandica]
MPFDSVQIPSPSTIRFCPYRSFDKQQQNIIGPDSVSEHNQILPFDFASDHRRVLVSLIERRDLSGSESLSTVISIDLDLVVVHSYSILTAFGRKISQRNKAVTPSITATAMTMLKIRLRMQQPQQRKQLPMRVKQQQPNCGVSYLRLGLDGGGGIESKTKSMNFNLFFHQIEP